MTIEHSLPSMEDMTVADVALTFPQALEILNRYNLDYCCGGKRSFTEMCAKAGLDPASVWQEIQLSNANYSGDKHIRFDKWTPPLLIDFIVQNHHSYVRESIPHIQELLDKVCNVHGEDSPYLLLVREDFDRLAEELLDHLPKEEQILFPAVKELYNQVDSGIDLGQIPFSLKAPVAVMEQEHEHAGYLVRSIRALTNNYTAPAHACPTFRMAYNMLNQFDNDLMQHIHLENNILFPKIKKLQEEILKQPL